jgi:hypothetical protein
MKNIQQSTLTAMRLAATKGIAKRMRADLGGAKVNFRGIEDAMNEMSTVLIEAGITMAPKYSELSIVERAKGEGKATRFVTLKGTFTFTAEDQTSSVCEYYGEAMDSGDKAVTKAQSVSLRTALFQTFCVPTQATAIDPESDPESDDAPDEAIDAAERGTAAYQAYWSTLKPADKKAMQAHHDGLKRIAAQADKQLAEAA